MSTVFIVNRDPSMRGWIEATVTSAGLQARTFGTRAELLPHVQAGGIACAILDVNLSDGSAFDLQVELARAGVATLFLTGEPCYASCVRALKAGAVDFLTMPCNSASLVHALRDALRLAQRTRGEREQIDAIISRH